MKFTKFDLIYESIMNEDKTDWLIKQGIPENIVKLAASIDKKHTVWIAQQLNKAKTPITREDMLYIMDWVDATSPNLSKFTYEQAKIEADKWHTQFEESDDENLKYKSHKVVYTFANGWQMVRLTPEDCEVEGEKMGHCVGQYKEKVKQESSWIFSLRDTKNEPHATIEFKLNNYDKKAKKTLDLIQVQGKSNQEPIEEYKQLIMEWIKDFKEKNKDDYNFVANEEESYDLHYMCKKGGPDEFYGFTVKSAEIGGDQHTYEENIKQIMDWTNDLDFVDRAVSYFKCLANYAAIFNELEILDNARTDIENEFLLHQSEYLQTEHPDRPMSDDYDSIDDYQEAMIKFETEGLAEIEGFNFFQKAYEIVQELKNK